MKNTEQEIIERFQKLDFDPNETNQKQIFNKITASSAKRRTKRFGFAFATAFSIIAAVLLVNNYPNKGQISGFLTEQKDYIGQDMLTERPEAEEASGMQVSISKEKEQKVKKYSKTDKPQVETIAVYGIAEAPASKAPSYADIELSNYTSVSEAEESIFAPEPTGMVKAYSQPRGSDVQYRIAAGAQPENYYDNNLKLMQMSYSGYDYNAMQDESYKKYEENSFRSTASDPLSTFSADVDAASYNIIRRVIMSGSRPNPDSVRIEEFLNYFNYTYPQPQGKDPVSMNFEYTDSPWNKGLKLVKIGVKAKDIEKADLPASNMVFLIDVSGSMEKENRLPLVKKSLKMLIGELRPEDKVSIVTYANGVSEVLSGAQGSEKERIINIIDNLYASGGTSGSEGLSMAYETAKKNFIKKGNNRIILATDGDFNIGPSSESELENQIVSARDSGVFLSVLGYGMGNYKDSKVQTLANKGNGNYAYINDLFEARKTLVKEFGATLFTVAKDVKLQVEFNPAYVAAYRLAGYEKRALNTQDFNDDTKDAGEIGAGHNVTVIYEIIPAGVKSSFMPDVEALKYTKTSAASGENGDVLTLKLRYKDPDSDTSKLMEKQLKQSGYVPFDKTSDDMRFAASVVQFGQILKDSQYKGEMTIDEVISAAKKAKGADDDGYRADLIKTAEMYKMIR
ncbi:MAG: VWA domain-containing protein [Clostridiales bacterium]|jgi:Ca-activated chloride channel family protein|nr:VWA domain-containing protein [Clostridiales bacterium]